MSGIVRFLVRLPVHLWTLFWVSIVLMATASLIRDMPLLMVIFALVLLNKYFDWKEAQPVEEPEDE